MLHFCCIFNSKYSNVRKWTLGLEGGKDQIAIIRASGSISRTRSPLSISGSGIISEQLIEKIRSIRGSFNNSTKYIFGFQVKNLTSWIAINNLPSIESPRCSFFQLFLLSRTLHLLIDKYIIYWVSCMFHMYIFTILFKLEIGCV